MRVAIVTHNVIRGDGQGRVNFEIASSLIEHGHEVVLIADQVCDSLLERGVKWIPVHPIARQVTLFKVLEFAMRANRVLDDVHGDVDLVVANGVVCTKSHDVNIVHFVHSTWLDSPFRPYRNSLSINGIYQYIYTYINSVLERVVFGRTEKLVGVSHLIADELQSLHVSRDKISVIQNGVDLDEFAPGIGDRASLGLPSDVPLALFAGDIRSSRKNLDTVLRALQEVPGWHLAVAGSTESSPFPRLAQELRVADRVHFLGFRDDIPRLMRASDVFVFPSRYEPFALVVLEALASGMPVITASTVGAAEILQGKNTDSIVMQDPEDKDELVRALSSITRSTDSKPSSAERSIAEEYGWENMAGSYVRMFEARRKSAKTCRDLSSASLPA